MSSPNKLFYSLLTLNIYFGQGKSIRTPALISLICKSDVDAVCLQEVTPFVYEMFLAHAGLCHKYCLSPFTTDGYGVLMLVKKTLGNVIFTEYELPTEMDRTLLVAQVKLGTDGDAATGDKVVSSNEDLVVATAHFESLSFPNMRRKQLAVAEEILRPFSRAVLAGDFNFDATRNFKSVRESKRSFFSPSDEDGDNTDASTGVDAAEEEAEAEPLENLALRDILPTYIDVWLQLHPTDEGYTFDSKRNGTINQYEQMRYDRVMSRGLQSQHIQLVGTTQLPSLSRVIDAGGWDADGLDIGFLTDGDDNYGDKGNIGMQVSRDLGDKCICLASKSAAAASFVPAAAAAGATPVNTPPSKVALKLSDMSEREDEGVFKAYGGGGLWLSDHFGLLYKFSL